MEYDSLRGVSYAENMSHERAEARFKDRAKIVEERATALVNGAGDWVGCKLRLSRTDTKADL
jgi:hypothetical protein